MEGEKYIKIKRLISDGKLEESIKLLLEETLIIDRSIYNRVLLENVSFSRLERDFLSGLINYDKKRLENTRTTLFLLGIIDEVGKIFNENRIAIVPNNELVKCNHKKILELRLKFAKTNDENLKYLIKEEILERERIRKNLN